MKSLKSLGWNNFFEENFNKYKSSGFTPVRISVEHKHRYEVISEKGILTGEVTGRLLYSALPHELPKPGDWAAAVIYEDEEKAIIHDVLQRKSVFARKSIDDKTEKQVIASNIDYIFIVQSLDNNFNIRRLERYILMAKEGGCKPVIILNKADLCSNKEEKISAVKAYYQDIKIITASSVNGEGINDILEFISDGVTAAFVGSSGVGKSSLINVMAGENILETGGVRLSDSRGRHTTTRREMVFLKSGGMIIDTPGMREFGVVDSSNSFEDTFADITGLIAQCKFSNCTHNSEPGCAVSEALENGSLNLSRYKSFLKLKKEIEYHEQKDTNEYERNRKEWSKKIHKLAKEIKAGNPKHKNFLL